MGAALRDVLLAAKIALCCITVTAAFVSWRGLSKALTTEIGIQPEKCLADEIRFEPGCLHKGHCRAISAAVTGEDPVSAGSRSRRLCERHAAARHPVNLGLPAGDNRFPAFERSI